VLHLKLGVGLLRKFLVSFLNGVSQSSYSGQVSYRIIVRKISAVQYIINLHLMKIELTDMSKYAFVLIDKRFVRVSYITSFKISLKYLTATSKAGPRQIAIDGVVSN